MNKELTLIIATYNRKERLLEQLHSIYSQRESHDVEIVICDNHSDYNVQEAIEEEFNLDEISNLDIIVNDHNIGMGANLALMLLKSKTPWLWTLSDDDITLPNSISSILQTIRNFPDVGMIKFSIDSHTPHEDVEISTFEGVIDYFYKSKHKAGDFIFLSNTVYKKTLIDTYFSLTLGYCYTLIPQLMPAFFALDNKNTTVYFCSIPVVRFVERPELESWNLMNGALGTSVLTTIPFKLSFSYKKKLIAITMGSFNHIKIIIEALQKPEREYAKFLYEQIYSRSFRFMGRFYDPIIYLIFKICYLLRIKPMFLLKLYPMIQRIIEK